jgi:hypothetical protein
MGRTSTDSHHNKPREVQFHYQTHFQMKKTDEKPKKKKPSKLSHLKSRGSCWLGKENTSKSSSLETNSKFDHLSNEL